MIYRSAIHTVDEAEISNGLVKAKLCLPDPSAGFSADPEDYDIRVEHRRMGFGVCITADRPLARFVIWSVRPTRCPEPFINVRVEPGTEFTWQISYEIYVSGSRP